MICGIQDMFDVRSLLVKRKYCLAFHPRATVVIQRSPDNRSMPIVKTVCSGFGQSLPIVQCFIVRNVQIMVQPTYSFNGVELECNARVHFLRQFCFYGAEEI